MRNVSIWVLLLVGFALCCNEARAQKPAQANLVITGNVYLHAFSEEQSFVGSVDAVRQTTVGSAVAGRVGGVFFEQGDRLAGPSKDLANGAEGDRGQVLIELETNTLQIEIDAAHIQLELAEQAHAELQLTLPIELQLAEARIADAESRLVFSDNEFRRMTQIDRQASAVSQTELEQARSQYQTDQHALALAKIEFERLNSTREVRLRQSATRINAAKQDLVRLQDLKSKYSIRAPFDGFVTSKLIEVGAWLSIGDPVVEIVALDEVDFAFNVPQEFVGKIQQAMTLTQDQKIVSIQIDGYEQRLRGVLLTVVPKVDLRSRLVTVRARVSNPLAGDRPLLKPGMLGRASLSVGAARKMLVLSPDALVLGGPRPLVYKLAGNNIEPTVVAVPVETGSSTGSWIEVRGDIAEGDRVVVEGNERLTPGAVVTIKDERTDAPTEN